MKAFIAVDVQNDFCPSGALPVPGGDQVVPVLNEYIRRFRAVGAPIYATRDWHPANHMSFKEQGGIWPVHCVQNTPGAEFRSDLDLPEDVVVISKATEPDQEAYSGFQGTDLAADLRARSVKQVFIGGLATDYCVKSTVLDSLEAGFETYLLTDASRGVDVQPGDSEKAIEGMIAAGAHPITLADL
ncbi:MAG TPA: nicotinamidase [Anaerolineae bacterium]|nr:nicotinamidase [Anaerolineae bacterium]